LKEEALDRSVWRTRFGRDCRPVVRQTTEWITKNVFIARLYSFERPYSRSGISNSTPTRDHGAVLKMKAAARHLSNTEIKYFV
jgi:hypothetical protein